MMDFCMTAVVIVMLLRAGRFSAAMAVMIMTVLVNILT
jgi:hypothetical protein